MQNLVVAVCSEAPSVVYSWRGIGTPGGQRFHLNRAAHTTDLFACCGCPVLTLEWTSALLLLCRQFDQGRPIEPYRGGFDEPVASRPYGVCLLPPVASAPRDLCRAADAAAMPASLSRLCLVAESAEY